MNDIKELYDNYLLAIREKVIKEKEFTKEEFFEIHKDYPNGMKGVPSHIISQQVMDYYKLHNHSIYLYSKKKSTCPICNKIKVKKKKA